MSKNTLAYAILLALATSTTLPALANNMPQTALEPLVVTATKTPERSQHIAARVNIINKETLTNNPIANLDGVLHHDAAANVVTSGGIGQTSSIFLRGSNSAHTLVLRDGARLNNAASGSAATNFIDTSDVAQVEIVKGASSVLHGSDAIGGVVQLISQTPTQTGGFITGIYGENNTYKTIIGADLLTNYGVYAQLRTQRLESDGTPVKDFVNAPNADYDQKGGSIKLGFATQQAHVSADYAHHQGHSAYDNYGMATSHNFTNKSFNLKARMHLNDQMTVHSRLSQVKDDLVQNEVNYLGAYDYVNSTTKEAEVYATWALTPAQTLLLGTTQRLIDGDALSYGTAYHESVRSDGYYVQHQYAHNQLNTQLGIRLEDNSKYGKHTVAQGAARYHFSPSSSAYINIGSAFRSPNLNELYAYGGNKNLKPEESLSYELGFDQHITADTKIGLSVYQTNIKNLINTVQVNANSYQNQNIDKAKLTGAELSAKWTQGNYFLVAHYNYVQPKKDDANKTELSRRPRHNGALSLGLDTGKYALSTTIRAKSNYDNSAFDDVKIPGHAVVDLNAHWHINNGVKLLAAIENVGDVKYRTAFGGGSYYIHGGRQANIGLNIRY